MTMTITLDLPADIAKELQAEAARQGRDPRQIVLDALAARLRDVTSPVPHLDQDEAELVRQISLGFSSTWWARYEALKNKRRAETLTLQEHEQLIQMSDELEQANARRIHSLVGLAQLRGTSLEALMQEFGLTPPAHA